MHTSYAHFLCLGSLTHARLVPASLEYWHNFTGMWCMGKKWASRGKSSVCTRLMEGKERFGSLCTFIRLRWEEKQESSVRKKHSKK